MAIFAVHWAQTQKTGEVGAKALLLLLAHYADSMGVCRSSLTALADEAEMSEDEVLLRLAALEARGLIYRPRPTDPDATCVVLADAICADHAAALRSRAKRSWLDDWRDFAAGFGRLLRRGSTTERTFRQENPVFVAKGTPAWDAWKKARGGRSFPTKGFVVDGEAVEGWFFPSLFPPALVRADRHPPEGSASPLQAVASAPPRAPVRG